MEHDRYQQNSKLFIIGIICLLLSLNLFAFGLYILPYLIWNWGYDVPDFILAWREWLKEYYNFTDLGASWLIILIFIIPAAIFGYISAVTSNYIDNQIYGIKSDRAVKESVKKEVQETLKFSLKIFFLILLVLATVLLVEWILASPSP